MTEFWNSVVTVAIAIIGIAGLAVLVSKNAQTPAVVQSLGQSLATGIGAAVAPVSSTGGLPSLQALPTGANYIQ